MRRLKLDARAKEVSLLTSSAMSERPLSTTSAGSSRASRGFTVLELLVSISLMSVIVIGLYTVFNQTQRALRTTMSQVDVLEGIRATSDLVVRDIESAVPVSMTDTNLTSMALGMNPLSVSVDFAGLGGAAVPVLSTELQNLYFVRRQNDFWTAVGYWVGPSDTNLVAAPFSIGRLYRFAYETNSAAFGYTNLYTRFSSAQRLLTSQPVMDGVVHFRVVAYDGGGYPLLYLKSGVLAYTSMPPSTRATPRSWFTDPIRTGSTAYHFRRFTHPQFPAYLDLELGVLEPQMVTRFNAIPAPAEARKFLARNAGKVHLFRHRILLRNAPPS